MNLRTKGSLAKGRALHGSTDDLIHDAASAHALMQAIDEIGTRGIQDADEIANRADEIMREWGF